MITKENFYNKTAYPAAVRKVKNAFGAETLKTGAGELTLKAGCYVIYDMGEKSVGGYPEFTVKGFTGKPLLRIAYSDRMRPFDCEETMVNGDFLRNSCDYLGVELPVMPANPYRFEEYEIKRTGKFAYPLVQGQERFVLIYLSEEKNGKAESVSISSFCVIDNSAEVYPTGYFESDAEILDRLWLASARTIRLATVCSRQWENTENGIALRKLAFSEEGAVFKGLDCKTLDITVIAEIYLNPEYTSGVGIWVFSDGKRGYGFSITADGKTALTYNGKVISKSDFGRSVANELLEIQVSASVKGITVCVNGKIAAEMKGKVNAGGSYGFYMQSEWRARLWSVKAICEGKEVEGASDTVNYGIKIADYYISDGAKRDRLPWTGDLFWALDGAWYAFGDKLDPAATFDILTFHQNPEGFVFGTCYPENDVKPLSKDYGYYQSDAFSVWFVVSALYYYGLSGDERIKKYYGVMQRCMDYAWRYVDGADNLFIQRYETSKGLWDHDLGDSGKVAYTNMLICDAYKMLYGFAKETGDKKYAAECLVRHKKMKKAILKHLYNGRAEGFVKKKGSSEICDLSNPYAMARGFADKKKAAAISREARLKTRAYGKIIALMVRGLYDNGYADAAEKLLFGKTPYYADGELYSTVDWVGAIGNKDFPETVYECMHNPPYDFGVNLNWGDLSHPDSAINGILSAYVAGIRNIGKGFDRILFKPFPYVCKKIRCGVPIKRGAAEIKIDITEKGSAVSVRVPSGTKIKTDFSALPKPVAFSAEYI
ncbi:MAG: hypothetical protein J6Y43_07975 [Clostridia bacterium]|nr:hypothetical protein [Clostridia bacterium]